MGRETERNTKARNTLIEIDRLRNYTSESDSKIHRYVHYIINISLNSEISLEKGVKVMYNENTDISMK